MIWGNELFKFSYALEKSPKHKENLHKHDGIEFLFVHEGTGKVIINQRTYRIAPRSLLFFKPHQQHQILLNRPYRRSGAKLRKIFSDALMQQFPVIGNFIQFMDSNQSMEQMYVLNDRQYETLNDQFRRLNDSFSVVPRHAHQEMFVLFLMQSIVYIQFHIFQEAALQDRNEEYRKLGELPEHVVAAIEWIDLHYRESLSLERLADVVHFSPSYISRSFRQYMGITLSEYAANKKLNEACSLLRHTSMTIQQIGRSVGFADPAYFCRMFKRNFGISPLQFRHDTEGLLVHKEASNVYDPNLT